MLFVKPTLVIALLTPFYVVADESQIPLAGSKSSSSHQNQNNPPHIAIVGAGIAGASTAFSLYELTHPFPPLPITIYETEFGVGGHVKSIFPLENPYVAVEAGATHFFTDDWCTIAAKENVGLKEKNSNPLAPPRTLGVWDGEDLRKAPKCNVKSPSWWDLVHSAWKYGLSPWRFRHAVLSNLKKWKPFARQHPFDSVVKELEYVGLNGLILASAETMFVSSVLTELGSCSWILLLDSSCAVKGNFYKLRQHSLDERMIRLSEADLRLNSQVIRISPGHHRRYQLSVARDPSAHSSNPEHEEFDIVILAAPLQSSKVDLGDLNLYSIASLTSYVETHVTHFTTPATISPKFFDPLLNASIPDDLLTTSTTSHDPDLLSISKSYICYKRGCLPGDDCDECDWENLYRVLSRNRMEDGDLIRMIGQKFHEGSELSDYDISWVHHQAWPHAFPRYQENHALLEDIEIAPDLFYLSGAEEVISSMEMSCRMGRKAAERLYWRGLRPPYS